MAVVLADTKRMSHEQWKEARKKGIGSSDAAAIAGLNPYRSPLVVYCDKLGLIPEEPENEAMAWGKRLEPVIAEAFADRTGHKVRRRHAILQHPDHPYALANLDFEVMEAPGVWSILECKNCNEWMADAWADDNIPDAYAIQVHHQLFVTGREHGWIAVLLGGNRLVYKRIDADPEVFAYLEQIESAFWQRVQDQNPPPADSAESTAEALRALYPRREPKTEVLLPVEDEVLVRQYAEAAAAEKAAQEQKRLARNLLMQHMAEGQIGMIAGRKVCTWGNAGFRLTKEAI